MQDLDGIVAEALAAFGGIFFFNDL